MKKHRFGFKVVRRFEGKLYGCCSWSEDIVNGRAGITEYIPGKYVEPREKHGPLCVFDSLKLAVFFTLATFDDSLMIEIWRCTFVPSLQNKAWRPLRYVEGKFDELPMSLMPAGKVLADRVKLTSQVKTKKRKKKNG